MSVRIGEEELRIEGLHRVEKDDPGVMSHLIARIILRLGTARGDPEPPLGRTGFSRALVKEREVGRHSIWAISGAETGRRLRRGPGSLRRGRREVGARSGRL